MEEKFLETLVVGLTKALLSESKQLFDEVYDYANDEIKQFIGKDITNYLNKQKNKYSHIKTLLRGNTPVYLYDIYFPAKLLTEKDAIISTSSSNELFGKYNFITIIGDAGSGKSTLVKHLFLNTIFEKKKIPVLIELRYLNETSDDLEIFIKSSISQNKLAVNQNILEKLLDKGRFVLFLDGYDEVDEKTKKKLAKQINDFVHKYNKNSYLLTSRPYSHIEGMQLFVNLKMKDLSFENGEIKGFVYKQLGSEKEMADKAIKSIEQGNSKYIHSFLKNPLLLSLYLLTFQNYASIPDKKYIFYRRVINALFSEHDSKTKLGFVREKLSGLDQEGFESILKSFSFLSYFENEFVFNRDYVNLKLKIIKEKKDLKFDNNKFIVDLKSAISIWTDDEGMLSFAHRSLQEYFTALFITELKTEENYRVYKKIIQIFEDKNSRPKREIENLLELLKEMDKYNYIKNFYHPLLVQLKHEILNSDKLDKQKKYLDFFVKGISSRTGDKVNGLPFLGIILKEQIHKSIYIHLPFTKKLYDYLDNKLNKDRIFDKYLDRLSDVTKERKVRTYNKHLIFDNELFEVFYQSLDDDILIELANEICDFVDHQIIFSKNYINNIDSTEKGLVDLI